MSNKLPPEIKLEAYTDPKTYTEAYENVKSGRARKHYKQIAKKAAAAPVEYKSTIAEYELIRAQSQIPSKPTPTQTKINLDQGIGTIMLDAVWSLKHKINDY